MTLNSFSSGVNTSFSTQLNNNFSSFKIATISTTSSLNISMNTTTTSSISASTELAIASSTIGNSDYVSINLYGYRGLVCYNGDAGTANPSISYKIEARATSTTTYTELRSGVIETLANNIAAAGDGLSVTSGGYRDFTYYHTLDSAQKAAGVTFRLTISGDVSVSGGTTGIVSFTNSQVVLGLHA